MFSEDDKRILTEEVTHKWRQTPMLYYVGVTLFSIICHGSSLFKIDGRDVITRSGCPGNG